MTNLQLKHDVMSNAKRFIAGATCPSCGEVDKLYLAKDEQGESYRACVRCDFSEQQRFDNAPAELETRVTRGQQEAAVQPVKLITPKS